MNPQEKKEKMLELIKKKQSGGRSKDMEAPKNDRKNMAPGRTMANLTSTTVRVCACSSAERIAPKG